MNKQRKTSNILNVFQYDETTGAVTLPSTLVLTAPASSDNSSKAATTAWARTYVTGLGYLVSGTTTTSDIAEGTRLYYTDARVGTYLTTNSYATQSYVGTQIANLVASAPTTLDTLNELAAALGNDPSFATTITTSIGTKVPQTRTITINGTSYDLTANRSWTINSMVYPSAGIALSTGTAWGTSITDNSSNWNTAYGWGNHASGGYLTSATAATTYVSLTGSYANPAWITSLAYSKITGVPAFLTSYTETDPYRVTSVAVTGTSTKTITITRADASTVTTTWTDIDTDTNTYVTSAAFSGGTLTLTRNDAGTITVSLDGRYLQSYTETDTLNSVTGRGATTANSIQVGKFGIGRNGASNESIGVENPEGTWLIHAYRSGTAVGGIHTNSGILHIQHDTNGEIALDTTGNVTWNSNIIATRSWVTSQSYLTGITSSQVTTALGYTPYNSTNPNGYITTSALSGYATQSWVSSQGYLTSVTAHNQAWSTITSTPTTLSGYGISDAVYSSTSSFTTSGTGWYRVATTAGDGRGYYYIEVYTTGGNHNPAYLRIEAMGDWGNDKLIAAYTDLGFPASAVRITRSSTTTFIEVNFSTTILGATARVVRLGFDSTVSVLSGALSAGGNTVQETLNVTSKINTASITATNLYTANLYTTSGSYINMQNHVHMQYKSLDYVNQIYQETGGQGNYMYANSVSSYGSLRLTSTRNGWYGIYFDSGTTLMMNSNESGNYRQGYGWQFRWYNGTMYVSTGSYGGGTEYTVLHSGNYNSYSPTLTGGGASGTWGINITGGAGSANLASQVTINYNNDSNSTYQLLWGSGNSVYGTAEVYVNPYTDVVYARGGFISPGNPWGTANSAYFPNGITTAGNDNWIYGHTYVGNAPGNGAGHEFWSDGSEYHRTSVVTAGHGQSGRWLTLNNAGGNYIPYSFESEYGNHSWGIIARFRINQSSDRPSIQFSTGASENRWNIGYCYADDQFRITQNMGYRNDGTSEGWGTERFRIDTSGNTFLGYNLYIGGQSSYFLYNSASGIRSNNNLLADGDIYLGTRGAWLSTYLNQAVRTDSSPTFGNYVYTNYSIRLGEIAGYGGLYRSSGDLMLYTESAGLRFHVSGVQKMYVGTNGNIWMAWAGDYISTLLDNKSNVGHLHDDRYFFDYGFTTGYPGTDANSMPSNRSAFTYSNNAPLTGCIAHFGAAGYGIQLNGDYGGNSFSMRSRNGDNATWRPWKRLLTDYNYGDYALPLGGGTMSGTLNFANGDGSLQSAASGGVSFYTNEINAGAQGGTGTLYLGWRRTSAVNIGTTLNMNTNTISNVYAITHPNAAIKLYGNFHFDAFNGNAIYLQYYNPGATVQCYADINIHGYSLASAYNVTASSYVYAGIVRMGDMWAGNGLYVPSSQMVFGTEGGNGWSFQSGAVQRAYFGGDGNLWMQWANKYISTLLDEKMSTSSYPYPVNMNQYVRTSDDVYFNSVRAGLRAASGMVGYGGGDWTSDFANTPTSSMTFGQDKYSGGPTGTWWFQVNMRHNNGSNSWGTQLAYGWEDNANRIMQRNVSGGNWSGWVEYLNSNNASYAWNMNQAVRTDSGPTFGEVYNNGWFRNNSINTGLYNQNTGVHFYSNSSSQWVVTGSGAAVYLEFRSTHQSTVRGYVHGDTSSNFGLLNNQGGWSVRCFAGTGYGGELTGSWSATGDITAYSDARIKENVQTIDNALEKVNNLRGVSYSRIDSDDKGLKIGVIAQETLVVVPEVVNQNAEGIYSVAYGNMAALFIEAIKEQQRQIEDLKKQIAYLVENK